MTCVLSDVRFCTYITYSSEVISCKPEPLIINFMSHTVQKSPEHATIKKKKKINKSLICLFEFSFRLWLGLLINLCKCGDVERNSAKKQLKVSLWLFFPLTKVIATTKPAVASLFNNFFSFPDFLLSFSCIPHSWPAWIHCLPFPSICYFQIISRGFMLESALGADFLGQQLSMMETNAAKHWDKWRREGNKKHALSSPA